MELTTSYMGMPLKNPLIAGASPLSQDVSAVVRAAEAGAAAVVMHSLFMEQISREQISSHYALDQHAHSSAEAMSYFPEPEDYALGPEEYLEQIRKLKASVDIPIIASLNGICGGDWTNYVRSLEEAGADAVEVNVYYLPLYGDETSASVEQRHLDVVRAIKQASTLRVAVKMYPNFSSPLNMGRRLVEAGADALVLFNRIFHPELDIENLEVRPVLHLSSKGLLEERLLWLAAMYPEVRAELAVTGGVNNATDVVRAVMTGASVVQVTSAVLRHGPKHFTTLLDELGQWLEEHEYHSIGQMLGSMSLRSCPDPEAFERANYMQTLRAWREPRVEELGIGAALLAEEP